MRLGKLALSCAAIVTLSSFGVGQDPSPSGASTLKVSSRETVVDVTVTDAHGSPVRGLKQSDFTILEDGVAVQPSSFVEHRSDAPLATPALPGRQDLPRGTFTNAAAAAPSGGPPSVLLLDSLNTTVQEQQRVAKSLLEYIDRKPPGMEMAVFRFSGQISIVQGFTADRNLLKAAISGKKLAAQRAAAAADAVGGDSGVDADHSSLHAQYALSAMRQIAGYLSGIPGRKNVLWFSGGFPLVSAPACATATPCDSKQGAAYDFTADAGFVTNLLAGAHIAVYPIESRGQDAPDSTGRNLRPGERSAMDRIAEQTGGRAFHNTNGFGEAVQQAVSSGSNFYTVTYASSDPPDTRFRDLAVKVNRSGVQLGYRSGYYAVDPGTSLAEVKVPRPTALQAAMLHGAPDANQIVFDAKVIRAPVTDQTLPESNQRAGEMKPPYQRFDIDYTTHVDKIAFSKQPDGSYFSDFEFVTTVFDAASGQALNTTTKEVRPVVPDSTYQSMLHDGAIAHQEIDVPAKGNYFLRIGVHDLETDRVGTLELQTSAIAPAYASRGSGEDHGALASSPPHPKSDAPTIKVYSRETVVDVTVTDKGGNPVHGLTRSAFTVKEDGKPQGIKSFEEFGTPSASMQAPPKLPPNVYTNLQPPAASSALNILLLDFVNTAPVLSAECCEITPCPFPAVAVQPGGPTNQQCSSPSAGSQEVGRAIAAQRQVKLEATKYLEHMPVGTRVEVVGMWWPGTLRVLQGFTSDPELLSAAVNTMNFDTNSTVAAGSGVPPFVHSFDSTINNADGMGVLIGGTLSEQICSQADGRDRMTLEVLQQIAANLAGVKGRKNLIWFTVGTPYITDPNTRPGCLPDYTVGLTRSLSMLLAAQVALYPVDARGIFTMPDDLLELSGKLVLSIHSLGPDPYSEFTRKTLSEQLSLESWAESTGGAAFYNTNDLAGALGKAIGKGANYYTLSYVPPGTKFDGRHHTIKVSVDQPNLSLVYRNGYNAEDPSTFKVVPSLTMAAAPGASGSIESGPVDMRSEMGRSLPTSQQVLFDVQVEPSGEPAKPSDPQMIAPLLIGVLDPKLKSKPLARYGFTFAIPGKQIAFAKAANGEQHGALEFDLAAYDSDGKVVTSLRQAIELNLTADQVAQLDHSPFHYFEQLDLPAGQIFLRIGVLDRTSNKVGTLEIPLTVAKSSAAR